MYAKLALRNVKRSIKDYLIYMMTLTLCVGLFYAFISLSSPSYSVVVVDKFDLSRAYDALSKISYLISSILILLIKYVNDYMIKRKKRAFALYTLMGMEQKHTAFMFFIETTIMGLISIAVGICIGGIMLQIMSAIILPAVGQSFFLTFPLYADSIFKTISFFLLIFILIGVFNVKTISGIKIIEMLQDEKVTEIEKMESSKTYIILGLVTLCVSILTVLSGKMYMYLYPLAEEVALEIVNVNKNWFGMLAFIGFVVFIFLFYYCCTYVVVWIRNKSKLIKYKRANLFILGQLSSKLKSSAILMSLLTITLILSMILLVFGPVLSEWIQGFGNIQSSYDVQISNKYNRIRYMDQLTEVDYSPVKTMVEALGYTFEGNHQVKFYFLEEEDFYRRRKDDFPVLAMTLSDYNELRAMSDLSPIKLGENTFMTHWNNKASKEDMESFMKMSPTIKVKESYLKLNRKGTYQDNIGAYLFNKYTFYTYIVPDGMCKGLKVAKTTFVGNTKRPMSIKDAKTLKEQVYSKYKNIYIGSSEKKHVEMKDYMSIGLKTIQENTAVTGSLLMKFICIYCGVVFLIISFTILSLQQLSDAYEHKKRFIIIKKLGMDEREINGIISTQMSIWFGLPVFISLLCTGVFIYGFYGLYAREVLSYIGIEAFIYNIMLTLGCIGIIECIYFVATYELFKSNIVE